MFGNHLKPLKLAKAVYSVALLAVFFLVLLATARAATVTLAWDESTSAEVTGYNIYYGTTSGGPYPTKQDAGNATIYTTPNLSDGTYYFVATAYDGSGNESSPSDQVSKTIASSPVASISASPTSGAAPLTVNFTGASTGGAATSWSWNFGDGTTSTTRTPSKTYSSAGTYTVTLTATGPGGSDTATKTNYISVTNPPVAAPVASFTATPTSGAAPLAVTLTDTSTGGSILSRSWNFGDGTTATIGTAQTFVKNYAYQSTPYTVTLTVTGTGGSSTKTQTITANAVQPAANFSAATTATPLTVKVSNSSTGTVTGWSWNFGDGGASTVQNPPDHAYKAAGTYTISLTATGPSGTTPSTKTQTITVSAASASTSGLVAAYSFDEASGATVVDASGKGNHGTFSSTTRTTGKTGYGNALSFNGTSDWVTVNDSASLDLTNSMTLEAWVYPTTTMSSWRSVLLKEQSVGLAYALYANSDSNQPVASLNIGSDQNLSGGSALAANTWVHLAATYDGGTQRLYVNGSQIASKTQTGNITVSSGALRIGGNSVWSEFFKGRIDEIRIYNRALSVSEIQADMNKAVTISSPPTLLVGDQQTGTKIDTISKGKAKAFQKQANKTGRVTSLSVNVVSGSTALVVGLYTNNNGRPGTLLAQGTLSAPKTGWNTVALPATAVTAGTTYWIAILSPSGNLQLSDRVGGGTQSSETSPVTTGAILPTTWWSTGTPSYDGPLAGYGAGY